MNTDILNTIALMKCNKVLHNDEVYEILSTGAGEAYLLKNMKPVMVKGKSVKLTAKQKEKAQIAYWEKYSDEFMKEKAEKEMSSVKQKALNFILEFRKNVEENARWLKGEATYNGGMIQAILTGFVPKEYNELREKNAINFFAEFPDASEFSERIVEIAQSGNIEDAYANLIKYLSKGERIPALGSLQFHAMNIEETLNPFIEIREKSEYLIFTAENESEEPEYLLNRMNFLLEEALQYVFTNTSDCIYPTYEEFKDKMNEMLMPDFIQKCYYGNTICEFTGEKTILYKGEEIKLSDEFHKIGTMAYRMQIDMQDLKQGAKTNGIYRKMEVSSISIDELGISTLKTEIQ